MKNKISRLFICYIVANILFVSRLFAAANISVNSVNAKLGDEITVDINIKDNPGFVGYQIALLYDTSKLQYISSKNGEVVEGKLAMISNNEKSSNVKQVCVGTDITGNGNLMSVNFKVKENISDSNIPLELKVIELVNDVDGKSQDVEYTVSNGNVVIKSVKGNIASNNTKNMIDVIKNNDGKISVFLKNNDSSKKIEYRSLDETKATVDENGNVTTISSGNVEIQALVDGEVVDTVTINIPSEDKNNITIEEKKENNETNLNKKYSIIFVIALIIIILAIVFSIIIYLRNKKRRRSDVKK